MIGVLAMAFTACKKSPETIGNNLISDNNFIGVFHTDTIALCCHSYLDSINTKNPTYGLLGSMNDPVFGLSQAGFSTQFRFSAAGQNFGSDPVLDSLVLQLCLSDYYGDTTAWQTLHAYVLTDTLSADEDYYNHSTVAYDESIDHANGYQFQPHPYTKTHIIGSDTISQAIIRVPLSNELGNYLMTLDSTIYKEPGLFKAQFHGLCLRCEPANGNGNISSISLTNNSYTLMQLYYHNADTPEKAMRYDYYITSSDTYFNQISHDYTLGDDDFIHQVLEGDTAQGQQRLYLQTMGGVRAKITFPGLKHWGDTLENAHIVINEAKLIVPAATVDTAVFTSPNTLVLLGFNTDGTTFLLPDYYEGTSYFGGTYSSTNNSAYFRISEYLQDILLGATESNGLSLGINGGAYNAQRLVVNGPEAENNPMRVEITYSIVNE